jgi:DNA modification methylase
VARKRPAPTPDQAASWWPVAELIPWDDNPIDHPPSQLVAIRESIDANGWGRPLVAHWPSRRIIAGHGTAAAAQALVALDPEWTVPGASAPGLVPVRFRFDDWEDLEALALADNKTAERRVWNDTRLRPVLERIENRRAQGLHAGVHGFRVREVRRHLRRQPVGGDTPPPPVPLRAISKPGEAYDLGPHRLVCGDSTNEDAQAFLFNGVVPDITLTDPPYCSGGFQESGKGAGSVGTRGDEVIARDTLSTRGYQALMRRVLTLTPAGVIYVFTDWRMWVNLFDVVEACGYGVRNMIVWDKGTPGMGVGWRHQHELVMAGTSVKSPFDPKLAQGNVLDVDAQGLLLQAKRTGNRLHATEKPVELCRTILEVTDVCRVVHDPFAGSGSTLIAAAETDRVWRGMELTPHYCDVIRTRWGQWARAHDIDPGPHAIDKLGDA